MCALSALLGSRIGTTPPPNVAGTWLVKTRKAEACVARSSYSRLRRTRQITFVVNFANSVNSFVQNAVAFLESVKCQLIELAIAVVQFVVDKGLALIPGVMALKAMPLCVTAFGDPQPDELTPPESSSGGGSFVAQIGTKLKAMATEGLTPVAIFNGVWAILMLIAVEIDNPVLTAIMSAANTVVFFLMRVLARRALPSLQWLEGRCRGSAPPRLQEGICGNFGSMVLQIVKEIIFCNADSLGCTCSVPVLDFSLLQLDEPVDLERDRALRSSRAEGAESSPLNAAARAIRQGRYLPHALGGDVALRGGYSVHLPERHVLELDALVRRQRPNRHGQSICVCAPSRSESWGEDTLVRVCVARVTMAELSRFREIRQDWRPYARVDGEYIESCCPAGEAHSDEAVICAYCGCAYEAPAPSTDAPAPTTMLPTYGRGRRGRNGRKERIFSFNVKS